MNFINRITRLSSLLILLCAGWAAGTMSAQELIEYAVETGPAGMVGTANGTTSIQPLMEWNLDDVGVGFAFDQSSASNSPAYYYSDSTVRLYKGNTFNVTAASGKTIDYIVFYTNYSKENGNTLAAVTSGEISYDSGNKSYTWLNTANQRNALFSINEGQLRITRLIIGYHEETGNNPNMKTWKAYFTNDPKWDNVMVWIWDDWNDYKNYTGGSWPGAQCSLEMIGDQVYWTYSFTTYDDLARPMIIFNNGNNGEQTADLEFVNNGVYNYDGYTGACIENGSLTSKPLAPVFSRSGGEFYETFELSIYDVNTYQGTIRYTLDGSDPDADHGEIYTGPIIINTGSNVTVKAVVVRDDSVSPMMKATYTYVEKYPFNIKVNKKGGINFLYYSTDSAWGEFTDDCRGYAAVNENVYVGVEVNPGYEVKSITVGSYGDIGYAEANSISFLMPAHEIDINIDIEFNPASPGDPLITQPVKNYNLTLVSNPAGASNIYGGGQYSEGELVYVSTYAYEGYVFTGWTKDGEIISYSKSFYYTMPSSDAVLVANYVFDPSSPGDPDMPKPKHPLTVVASPSGGGYFNLTNTELSVGETFMITAYPSHGYKFRGWVVNGVVQESTARTIYGQMTEDGVHIVGLFVFDPDSPSNPNSNFYDPLTGKVIIDDFTPGNLHNTIDALVGYNNFSKISTIIVKGETAAYDYGAFSRYENVSVIDLSRTTGVSTLPDYSFESSHAASITLPATLTGMGSYVFNNCSNLTALTVYAVVPPTCVSSTFANFTNKANCTVYVPATSVELYKQAQYWKDFEIKPIDTDIQIGVVTPEDPEGWNDLTRPHRITIEGEYTGIGQNGRIEYAAEGSEVWIPLTEMLSPGSSFTASLTVNFISGRPEHTIALRMVDATGEVTMLDPVIYKDINFIEFTGIENKVYDWGEPITQSGISCELEPEQYLVTNYADNINAGKASFNVEGVYPYTIGRKTFNFTIAPLLLSGEVAFVNADSIVYNGAPQRPEWRFTDDKFGALRAGYDYEITLRNNILPGKATMEVRGINNFTGTLAATFLIDKAELQAYAYEIIIPAEDITFDGNEHPAYGSTMNGVGDITIYYASEGSQDMVAAAPSTPGKYDVYVEIAEGNLYHGKELTHVGSFTIYQFNDADWALIKDLNNKLIERGWEKPWDISGGVTSVASLKGLRIEKGRVTSIDLSAQGLSGTFPVEILAFNNLRAINLSSNLFSGALEDIVALVSQNLSNIEEINIAYNKFSGNVGAFAAAFPSLHRLYASYNHISDVYPVIAPEVEVDLYRQTIDKVVELDLADMRSDEFIDSLPTILFYNSFDQTYCDNLVMYVTSQDGWTMYLICDKLVTAFANLSGQTDNAYHGKSGDILDAVAYPVDNATGDVEMKLRLKFDAGDASFDGSVDVVDLQVTILYAFDDFNEYPFNFTAADTYADDWINVQDVICTANLLLADNGSDNTQQVMKSSADKTAEPEACVYIEGNKLYLNSSRHVAAIDIAVDGRVDWGLSQYGFMSASNDSHLVGYSLSGATLPTGIIELGEVAGGTRIAKCVLSDERAKRIEVVCNQATSIDVNYNSDNQDNIIFDVNGLRVKSLGRGLNIVIDRDGVIKKTFNGK